MKIPKIKKPELTKAQFLIVGVFIVSLGLGIVSAANNDQPYIPPQQHHAKVKKVTPSPPATSAPVAQAPTPVPPPAVKPTGCAVADNNVEVLINQFRASKGLSKLCANQKLRSAAAAHAQYLCSTNTFSHAGYDGFAVRAGYGGLVGENITAGYQSAEAVLNAWVNSPDHYANLVSADYKEQGIAGFDCPPPYLGNTETATIISEYLGLGE